MKEAKRFIINRLLGDATLLGLLGSRNVFASQRDFIPEVFPAIAVFDVGGVHRSIPGPARDSLIQVSIFGTTTMLDVDTIYERVTYLLNTPVDSNAKEATTNGTQLWWMREDGVVDVPDDTRTLYHKAVTYRVWGTTP